MEKLFEKIYRECNLKEYEMTARCKKCGKLRRNLNSRQICSRCEDEMNESSPSHNPGGYGVSERQWKDDNFSEPWAM